MDPTTREFILQVIDEELHLPKLAVVKEITEHTADDDTSNHELRVKLVNGEQEYRDVPVSVETSGDVMTPEEDDMVMVQFLAGDSRRPIVTDVIHDTEKRAPLGAAGMFRRTRGDLYMEMHPNGDWVRVGKKTADDAAPDITIEIDDTVPEINITTNGASVNLGDESKTMQPVARKGDAVSGTTETGDSFSGTIDDGSNEVNSS